MFAFSVKGASDAVAWLRRKRRIETRYQPLMLNLGCYLFVCNGWINIDGSHHILFRRLPKPLLSQLYHHSQIRELLSEQEYLHRLKSFEFVHHNLIYGIPFRDESADYIYTSHFLEHMYQDQAEKLLCDAYRVLKTGGCIRVCVPDLRYAVDRYLQGQKKAALQYFFQPSAIHPYERHKYMYDFELLTCAMRSAGFHAIERCGYQQGKVPNLDLLDNRPEETLYVEANK